MGLSNKKEDQLRKQPIIETTMRRSQDGNFLVIKTTFTEIKPVKYVEKVLSDDAEPVEA